MSRRETPLDPRFEKARQRRETVRLSLVLGVSTWMTIERLAGMHGMTQREVFDLALFSAGSGRPEENRSSGSREPEAERRVKKTVVMSRELDDYLNRRTAGSGLTKSRLAVALVEELFREARTWREDVADRVGFSNAVLKQTLKEMESAEEQLRVIWGERDWKKVAVVAGQGLDKARQSLRKYMAHLERLAPPLDEVGEFAIRIGARPLKSRMQLPDFVPGRGAFILGETALLITACRDRDSWEVDAAESGFLEENFQRFSLVFLDSDISGWTLEAAELRASGFSTTGRTGRCEIRGGQLGAARRFRSVGEYFSRAAGEVK